MIRIMFVCHGNICRSPMAEFLLKDIVKERGQERRALRLQKTDYGRYDYFICMDDSNVRNGIKVLDGDPEGKVKKLLDFTGEDKNVSDPWYTGDFHVAYDDILRGCEALTDYLKV
ncbi:MAG: low molecular weight phosphotyrosine protein phosphatase [Clostridiales bacterium]|nr:low molecular weight phosphotyrosine protein phosphatase [Clostridiales bacterium]